MGRDFRSISSLIRCYFKFELCPNNNNTCYKLLTCATLRVNTSPRNTYYAYEQQISSLAFVGDNIDIAFAAFPNPYIWTSKPRRRPSRSSSDIESAPKPLWLHSTSVSKTKFSPRSCCCCCCSYSRSIPSIADFRN